MRDGPGRSKKNSFDLFHWSTYLGNVNPSSSTKKQTSTQTNQSIAKEPRERERK